MASTTNKNTPGNYSAEQRINTNIGQYLTYKHSSGAKAYTNHHPGLGVLPAKTARSSLCTNFCDVESQLFGIGSTNVLNVEIHINFTSFEEFSNAFFEPNFYFPHVDRHSGIEF